MSQDKPPTATELAKRLRQWWTRAGGAALIKQGYDSGRDVRSAANLLESQAAEIERMREALRLLVADVEGYEAWQRPCYALDVARAALAPADGEQP